MESIRDSFEAQLTKDGQTEKLTAFREAVDRLKGDSVAAAIFTLHADCEYRGIPYNDGSEKWGEYVRTGIWNGVKKF